MKKRLIFSAGGTGGHLFPAQVVAKKLMDCDILFVAGKLSKTKFFEDQCFPFKEIDSSTFSFANPLDVIKAFTSISRGIVQSVKIILDFCPDAVVGFGSFHSLPLLCAALLTNRPIILHEQNFVPGRVNTFFSRFAKISAITFPNTPLAGKKTLVRFPIRKKADLDPWEHFGLKKGIKTFLVFGGSRGARQINRLFLGALHYLNDKFQVIHFTGEDYLETAESEYQKYDIAHYVRAFDPDVLSAMEIADLAIARAGASTIFELTEMKTPAILIPYPYASDNHQEGNANQFIGGEVYLEKDLSAKKLAEIISRFPIELKKNLLINNMVQNDPVMDFADLVKEIIENEK